MKKIDKLLLTSFAGPFVMTFLVIVFILLSVHMLRYFDDIIGKGLEPAVIANLLFYFAVLMTPNALPLSILVSSLIMYGNLSEYGELSAIKSAGISLPRIMLPIFVVVIFATAGAFLLNNSFVPRAALEAYSLMYDIKKKKPALNLHEGMFYDGVPGLSIKADKTHSDGTTLEGIILYDHRKDDGNREVIIADSGRMSTLFGDSFLKFELYRGYNYSDVAGTGRSHENEQGGIRSLSRRRFSKSEMVFDLQSIQLTRTDKELSQNYRMKNLSQLDSMSNLILQMIEHRNEQTRTAIHKSLNFYHAFETEPDPGQGNVGLPLEGNIGDMENGSALSKEKVRQVKAMLQKTNDNIAILSENLSAYKVQWHKILANSIACVAMFLIGAPLGSIIRKGGIGVPFLVSIFFFILFYVISIQGEKLAHQGIISAGGGAWASNIVLAIVGLVLLIKAHKDSPLFNDASNGTGFRKIKLLFLRMMPGTRR